MTTPTRRYNRDDLYIAMDRDRASRTRPKPFSTIPMAGPVPSSSDDDEQQPHSSDDDFEADAAPPSDDDKSPPPKRA